MLYSHGVRAWLVVLLSSVAAAAPNKPVRKPAPPNLAADRLDEFVEAVLYDKAGDYERAVSNYERAGKDLPNVLYNIADLYRRMERFEDAIEAYKKYLEASPKAPDRAAVEKLVAELAKMPTILVVDGDDLDAVVFVDGKLVGASPITMPLPDGEHVVDRIGPATHTHDTVYAKAMKDEHVSGHRDESGNVVLSTNIHYGGSWEDGGHTFEMDRRFTLPAGRYDTFLFKPGLSCTPLSFQVPPEGLVYVFVDGPRDLSSKQCAQITVRAQKVTFPKAKKEPRK